jgi:hypothetical protein
MRAIASAHRHSHVPMSPDGKSAQWRVHETGSHEAMRMSSIFVELATVMASGNDTTAK